LRGWVITLIAGVIVLLTQLNSGKFSLVFLAILLIIFWCYDGYFLALERGYRDLYDKVKSKKNSEIDFSMKLDQEILDRKRNTMIFCIFSPTLLFFYGPLLVAALYAIFLMKG